VTEVALHWRDVPAADVRAPRAPRQLPELSEALRNLDGCVLTAGTFDGMHTGHVALLGETMRSASVLGVPSVLLIVEQPAGPQLTSVSRRAEIAIELGIDEVRVVPPFRSLGSCLADVGLLPDEVVLPQGSPLGAGTGRPVRAIRRSRVGRMEISSTYVRCCVGSGDMETARAAMARAHRVDGVVEHGDHRGRDLGFPTANLAVSAHAAVPADGVYVGKVVSLDEWGRTSESAALGTAAISVGTNVTFDGKLRRIEAHVLDLDEALYGRRLGFEFHRRLRGMVRFDGVDSLVEQMHDDVMQARASLG
jgi:riboflavin kinase/FMN adenylyltransferase